jgi:uncharacterized protein involved in exopolysaccharide biosynthesis
VSAGAEPVAPRLPAPELGAGWTRLERTAEHAAGALVEWRRRALAAEAEVVRLRQALEGLSAEPSSERGPAASDDAVRQLRAENAALRSRLAQARQRVHALLARLSALEAGW